MYGHERRVEKSPRHNRKTQHRPLILFGGTQSVVPQLQEMRYEVGTMDWGEETHPYIRQRVLGWDGTIFKAGEPRVVFASMPCTKWSGALATRSRTMWLSGVVVWWTVDVIHNLTPRKWFSKNPWLGEL